jgi:hypothetical protein
MGITDSVTGLNDPVFSAGNHFDSKSLGNTGNTVNNEFIPDWDAGFLQQLDGVILYTAETEKNSERENQ